MAHFSPVFVDSYDALKAGSIDGTDEFPHDRAVSRAMVAKYQTNKAIQSLPEHSVFVGRLNPNTSEDNLRKFFSHYGDVRSARLIRDIVTGYSKCYGFVEFEESFQARNAARDGHKTVLDDHELLVDMEKERTLKGWVPRRLGGGLGGKRESGQLRFGGRDRQFSRPILRPELQVKLDIDAGSGRFPSSGSRNRRSPSGRRGNRRSRSRSWDKNRRRSRSSSRSRHRRRSRSSSRSRHRRRSRSSSRR